MAGLDPLHRRTDVVEVLLQRRAMIGPEFEDGEFAASQVLLMPRILSATMIKSNPACSVSSRSLPVGQSAPAHLSGGFDFMGGKGVANLNGHALVQQDSHAGA